MTKAATN